MTNVIRDVVARLSDEECVSITIEADEWERTGTVREDATLRRLGESIESQIPGILILIMNDIVREVWRRFAMERVGQLSRDDSNG